MFEDQTYENILSRMLNRVPNNIDKREVSIVYNALAPAAAELAKMYIEANTILTETFASTANREMLIERAKERGKIPYEASKAIVKGIFNKEIPIGSRFTCGQLVYKAIEKISDFVYKMECETKGTVGNQSGTLIPIDYIDGLTTAELTDLLIPGQDEEDTESFRERYFNSFSEQAYGGNKADYIEKVSSIAGVGSCKAKRIVNEDDNIEITILDSNYNKATDVLVETVQNIIDKENDGEGTSIAPYNHFVKIQTVDEVIINVKLEAQYDTGYSFINLKSQIEDKIETELRTLRTNWANENHIIVRVAQLSATILQIQGILDITQLILNGQSGNIELDMYEIPIFGEVTDE